MNTFNHNAPIPTEKLTPRELEVLTLTARGKTRKEISTKLSISETTVKEYLERVCRKLKAKNKTHASTIAITLGLIRPYLIPDLFSKTILGNFKMPHNLQRLASLPQLSARELEVLTWAARGKTFPEISILLSISADTAKDHIERSSKKLNTKNKTHTVAVAVALGLIEIFEQTPPKVE